MPAGRLTAIFRRPAVSYRPYNNSPGVLPTPMSETYPIVSLRRGPLN